jgi:hypothetical protein
MTLGSRLFSALAELAHDHLHAVGILEDRRPAGFTRVMLRFAWCSVVVGVCFIPTTSEELTVFFPAILTLGATWLLAMPAYAMSLSRSDGFAGIRLHGVVARFFQAVQRQQIVLPQEATGESSTRDTEALLQALAPALLPAVFAQMFRWTAFRALTLCVFGVIGLVVSPLLAGVHWARGWSPVAVLIAIPTPALVIVVGSLLVPFITLNYLTQVRLQQLEVTPAEASPDPATHEESQS